MKSRLSLLAAGLLAATAAPAMYLNPQGSGQVLLFPYYSVNAGQSTLLSLVNGSERAKYLHVQFREGYNGRSVLDFKLVLAPHDAWTATVFTTGGGAVLMTRDESCTAPDKNSWAAPFPGGGHQQPFLPYAYIDGRADGGPTTIARTREGLFEIVEVAELSGPLADAASGSHPPNCAPLQLIDPASPYVHPPGGGLYGDFAIVDVAEGTLFGGRATAVDDYSQIALVSDTASLLDYLSIGNSRAGEVDAVVATGSGRTTLTYATQGALNYGGINALSALLMADSVQGAMSREAGVGSHTEWVLSAPTKSPYTDPELLDLPSPAAAAIPPFDEVFGRQHDGASCSSYVAAAYDREGRAVSFIQDPELAVVDPRARPQHALCFAANVVHFSDLPADGATPLLGSLLGSKLWNPAPTVETANVRLTLGARSGSAVRNVLPAGLRGPALRGLPLIGFEAVRYVNGNVAPGVLANYTMAAPLRGTPVCVDPLGGGATPCR
ncbi:hypothetical protein [Tahibacter caeni]|uniref:hypothetical protein n=1 Tax=Tahibacter caeni TaxID=1453545 RepID=UPI002148A59C|nr:hypothetical protein [Tahibacter caeni]